MSIDVERSDAIVSQTPSMLEEQHAKIKEVQRLLGQLTDKLPIYCSDASISRYLRARNWNVKKATKMLKETLKWRFQYKPEEIRWEEVASEAETGKIYRADYFDKFGRSVLVMRPGCQNTKSTKGQIRYLVYCMENAILNLPPEQEQMVWLIDFQGFNMSNISVKVTRETAHVLQDYYPERLGLAILYNPPKIFESFWTVVKPFLEPKTYKKVKFVYSDDPASKKIMEDLFDMEKLERAFGGLNETGFNIIDYAGRMKEDDKKLPSFWAKTADSSGQTMVGAPSFISENCEANSDDSDKEHPENSSPHELGSSHSSDSNLPELGSVSNGIIGIESGVGAVNLAAASREKVA